MSAAVSGRNGADFRLGGEVEGSALIRLALGPDPPTVTLDNTLHRCQPDARAFELFGTMQPLEHAEQFACVRRVEAGSVIPDKIDLVAFHLVTADLDSRKNRCAPD